MYGNNILHMAGKLPLTANGLRYAQGAALQLHQDLFWFEAVKKIVGLQQMKEQNEKGKTPVELFEEEHEKLRKGGEKWMKNIANSCMLVSTLVATMVFAAPGGVGQDNGIPILLHNEAFGYFAISDAKSLIASASSIFFFLSILTSSYSMENFRTSLYIKLILGPSSFFFAILTMMEAFIGTFSIIFAHQKTEDDYQFTGYAVVPVLLFIISIVLLPLVGRVYLSILFSVRLSRPN